MNVRNVRVTLGLAAAVLAIASCSVDPVSIPSPTGPSELALSLEMSATPDVISQDGISKSRLDIIARDANSQPMGGVPLRVDVLVPTSEGLVVADFGSLSDRWPTTGSNGRVSVTYQSPPQPAPTVTSDTTVTLRVTPIGTNYANSVARVVEVRLLRPGTIRPPTRMVPRFTYSPTNLREFDTIFFDASTSSDPDGHIVSYTWQFGDGRTGTGRQPTHVYGLAGTYGVVLTVSDAYGTSVSTTVTNLTVGTSAVPTANFTISPANAGIGTNVQFNAAASTATPGRQIVSFTWDLGDGTFTEGVVVQHAYTVPGSYVVTLAVTDDAGKRGVLSRTLEIGDLNAPVANFTFSPTSPAGDTCVVFNASTSTVPLGRTIVSYQWDFGQVDQTGSGVVESHRFGTPGTYTVTLTVTDNLGRKGLKSSTVTVILPSSLSGPGSCGALSEPNR